MLMSVNIVVDGIFVGNGVGTVALAGVNIAVPVFSIIISIALLVGIGAGTLFSMALGENNPAKAQAIYSFASVLITVITLTISIICLFNLEWIAKIFGADQQTLPYTLDYMSVLFFGALIIAWETMLSILIRNDGDPTLAMIGLVVSALLNIVLNYWMIFILEWGVFGAAFATILSTFVGLLIYTLHFLKKRSHLKFVKFTWHTKIFSDIMAIGFPSFLSEAGTGLFVLGYNIAMSIYIGTTGVSAFSIINYLHTFMFLTFIGISSSIQPMISFYYGAKNHSHIVKTVQLSEITSLVLGGIFIVISLIGSNFLVAIFGVESTTVTAMANTGLKLFFLGYLFMGLNMVYMTYYQSTGMIKPSIYITLMRGVILLIIMLAILPPLFGIVGIWLALPAAEACVAIFLLIFARKGILENTHTW